MKYFKAFERNFGQLQIRIKMEWITELASRESTTGKQDMESKTISKSQQQFNLENNLSQILRKGTKL